MVTNFKQSKAMQDIDVLRLERLERVKTFLEKHIGDFAPGSVVDHTRIEITDLHTTLNAVRVGQLHLSANKDEIIESLVVRFKDIACTARSILSDDPSFPEELFRFPGDYSEEGAAEHADAILYLLDAKHGDTVPILAEKVALRGRFTEYEMDPGFVGALRADRHSLAVAVANNGKYTDNEEDLDTTDATATLLKKANTAAKAERRERHQTIANLLNQANTAITRLNGPIQNKYSADPDMIHAWKQASRVESDPTPLVTEQPTA